MEDGEQGPAADRETGRRRRFTSPEHGRTGPTKRRQYQRDEPRQKDWTHAIPFKPQARPKSPLDDQAKLAARMKDGKRSAWITEEEWEWLQAWRRAKVCQAKQPFDTYDAAMREGRMRHAKKHGTPHLNAYRCGVCGKYHLTKRHE